MYGRLCRLTQPLQSLLLCENALLLALLQGGRKQSSVGSLIPNQLCHLLITLNTHGLHHNHNGHSIPATPLQGLHCLWQATRQGSNLKQ